MMSSVCLFSSVFLSSFPGQFALYINKRNTNIKKIKFDIDKSRVAVRFCVPKILSLRGGRTSLGSGQTDAMRCIFTPKYWDNSLK